MNQVELYKVLLSPHVSEKAYRVGDKHNQVVFKVLPCANKIDIKQAVELLFDVKVESVRTVNNKPIKKRFGKMMGQTKAAKKAYVKLKEGYSIDFAGQNS